MRRAISPLPDEVPALNARISAMEQEIALLKLTIAKLQRTQFGRRAERRDGHLAQLQFALDALNECATKAAAADDTAPPPPVTLRQPVAPSRAPAPRDRCASARDV